MVNVVMTASGIVISASLIGFEMGIRSCRDATLILSLLKGCDVVKTMKQIELKHFVTF